ncbi:MAG TPA: radical SAM family heme chaperone HemW [Puia sp.]|nr:radical SAM family heme chaperone HemW [Puia sp.]
MPVFDHSGYVPGSLSELQQLALYRNGAPQLPTREEFYTNYPFFKYWNTANNDRFLSPEPINIYIHIPFCIQICDYCFYMKELIQSKDQVNEYVDHLCKEIEMVSERFNLRNRTVNAIYIGGGTPSVLTETQFKKLMETLHRHHRIDEPEFAFEAEPGTFSKNKLQWLKESGVNRISIGVQSFDDEVIRLSSRKHTSAQAIQSIATLQETGGFEINVDLLSGLAGETMSTWQRSLDTALEQHLDMLTIYKMKTYANTTFFKKAVHTKEIELPSDIKEIAFMERALEKLFAAGYNLWTTFAFTPNGSRSRYAENTWRGQDLVAYGASSFGKIGNFNYQNLNNIHLYYQKIRQNAIPLYRTYYMTVKDMIVKELLLCGVRLLSYRKTEFIAKFGFDYFQLIPDVLEELVLKGYIRENSEELELTAQGVLFGDYVGKMLAASVKDALAKDAIGFTY